MKDMVVVKKSEKQTYGYKDSIFIENSEFLVKIRNNLLYPVEHRITREEKCCCTYSEFQSPKR